MKFIKYILITFFLLFILFFIDLQIFRGYFSSDLYNGSLKLEEVVSKDCELKIEKTDSIYTIIFKNNTIKPFWVWTYRWNVLYEMNDSIFKYHYRPKINAPFYENDYEFGLDCGTGAGVFSINPYENFTSKITQKQLIKLFYWGAFHQNYDQQDVLLDLIYNKPLLKSNIRKNEFSVFKRPDITTKDSINLQLYLPVFSYNHKELSYIKSNYIKLSYLDVVTALIGENSKVFKQVN